MSRSVDPAGGDRPVIGDVLVPFALTRILLLAVAAAAAATIPYGADCRPCDPSSSTLLSSLSRWDGQKYLSIARDGYTFTAADGAQPTAAFSPLLPMLMRGVSILAGRTDDDALLVAGILVSNAALLVGLAYLTALGRIELDAAAARRAALYLLVFPTTVFLSAIYPESLFLALAAGSLVEAKRRRWWLAGALAALATLARPFGLLLVVPLVVERLIQRRTIRRIGREALALAGPLLAFGAWQWYLYRLSGDPVVFLTAQATFRRQPTAPWEAVAGIFDPAQYGNPWIVLVTLVGCAALVVASWRVLSASTALCGTVILLASASSGTLTSFPRYALAIFPAFLVLGALGHRPAVHVPYLAAACALATILTAMFAAWYWIG